MIDVERVGLRKSQRRRDLLATIALHGEAYGWELSRELGWSHSSVYDALKEFLDAGLVERMEENPQDAAADGRGPRATYRLTDRGKGALTIARQNAERDSAFARFSRTEVLIETFSQININDVLRHNNPVSCLTGYGPHVTRSPYHQYNIACPRSFMKERLQIELASMLGITRHP
jgi:DNA-binding PadR family transcriptional regulator